MTIKYVSELLNENVIMEIRSKEDARYKGYIPSAKDKTPIDDAYINYSKYYLRLTEEFDEKQKEIERKAEEVKIKTNNIYTEIITIMGIFISIFAIIFTVFNQTTLFNGECIKSNLITIALVDGSLIITIFLLLIFIRLFVIKPVKEKEKKNKT